MLLQYGHKATTPRRRLESVCCCKDCPLTHLSETYHAGTHNEMNTSGRSLAFSKPQPARTLPFAQAASNTPFLFHTPAGMAPPPPDFWEPPQDFSPKKAFPPVVETADVSMDDVLSSPSAVKKDAEKGASADEGNAGVVIPARKISTNAVKRVMKGRRRASSRTPKQSIEDDEQASESEVESEGYTRESPINHHYTFNLPGLPANRSEVPYMLLGYVGSIPISFFYLMECTAAMYNSSSISLSF